MGALVDIASHRGYELRVRPADVDAAYLSQLGLRGDSGTGPVDEATLLSIPAVLSAVCTIADTMAMIPKKVYRRMGGSRKEEVREHPLHWVLNHAANEDRNSYQCVKTFFLNRLIRGNGYAEVLRDGSGRAVNLFNLSSWNVRPVRVNGRLVFEVRVEGGRMVTVEKSRIFHSEGFRLDGLAGVSNFSLASRTVRLAEAMENFANNYFRNGGAHRMALEFPSKLEQSQKQNIGQSWVDAYSDPNRPGVPILDGGLKAVNIGSDPDKSQMSGARLGALQDLARVIQIQPSRIGEHSNSTLANVEQQSIEYVMYTIHALAKEFEAAVNTQLLPGHEQQDVFCECLLDGLVRGDIESRYRAHATAIQWGFKTRNEVRANENLNPIEGLDEPLTPLNMTTETGALNEDGGGKEGVR